MEDVIERQRIQKDETEKGGPCCYSIQPVEKSSKVRIECIGPALSLALFGQRGTGRL
jgi:hypothetical protein